MSVVLSMDELSRGQQQRLRSGETSDLAEELVAEVFGLAHRPDRAEWYDAVLESTGTKYEVKSCLRDVGEEYPAAGRFRVRRDQTRSLTASSSSGAAWYAFVLVDYDAGAIHIQRRKPTTVSRIVRERGGWNQAGHAEFDEQHKLPIPTVVDV